MLILAAFGPELEPFSDPVRAKAYAIGVGAVTAAHATASLLHRWRPSRVVLVGSCGVYPSRARDGALGSVIVAERAVLVDAATVQNQGAVPPSMNTAIEMDPVLSARFIDRGFASGVVATTLGITTSDDLAQRIAAHYAVDFENLEAFAVAEACRGAGIACAAVLGVTNVVGSDGRAQWREHHVAVAAKVARAVEETLADLLEG